MAQRFQGHEKEAGQTKATLDKIRKVFAPDADTPRDPVKEKISEYEAQLDHYLEKALEAEKAGQPIPLTTNLAVNYFQDKIASEKSNADLQRTIQALQSKIDNLSNPQQAQNNQAYSNMDSHLITTLDTLFGDPGKVTPQKQAQFQAISTQVGQAIKRLQKEAPAQWDQIRRNPDLQKQVIDNYVRQNLPPAVTRMMEQEKLSKQTMNQGELWEAFREAKDIADPEERAEIRTKIRQQILQGMRPGIKSQRR